MTYGSSQLFCLLSAFTSVLGSDGCSASSAPSSEPLSSRLTFNVDFSSPLDPPLVKDKFGVYQTPLYRQETIQNSSAFLGEANVHDIRYEIGIGKNNALAYNQVAGTATSPTYNFSSIDGLFSSWSSVHTFPLLAFTYNPVPLQPSGGVFQDVPTNLSTWGSINSAYAHHFSYADARPGVWFEQWNEPDLQDGSGGKVFFKGNQTDYGAIYANGAVGLHRGDPDARVGGPAVAYDTTYLTQSGMQRNPIDFVSIHAYANYATQLSSLRSKVASNPSLPLLLTEYNSYTAFGATAPANLHHAAAAFFNDVNGLLTNRDTPKVYWAQWVDDDLGMLTSTLHRKAIYNAYKIYQTMLPADRVSVSPTTAENVGGMAGADDDNAAVALWNSNAFAVTATVNLTNLPFTQGTAQLYFIDQSNASYNDGATENLAVNRQWTFAANRSSWTGTIQAHGVAFIKAFDDSGQSLLAYNSIGNFIRSDYWYFNRDLTSYSNFDPWTSIARLGMGANDFDVAQIGNVYDYPNGNLTVTVTKSGPFSANDANSLFGLRFDFQNTRGIYDYSVLYTNGLYNSGRKSTLPWGQQTAVPNRLIIQDEMNTGRPFAIAISSIAPAEWNHRRVIISPLLENAGAGSRARIVIRPGRASTTKMPKQEGITLKKDNSRIRSLVCP